MRSLLHVAAQSDGLNVVPSGHSKGRLQDLDSARSPSTKEETDIKRSRGTHINRVQPTEASGEPSTESVDDQSSEHEGHEGMSRKRRRSRKDLDKKFGCPTEGCGKSYSRAEHLYRHQLNHTPKQIFNCDFPDCHRTFVRQDLCLRHRERHTTTGSQLQKKDMVLNSASPVTKISKSLTVQRSTSPEVNRPIPRIAPLKYTLSQDSSQEQ